MGLGIKTQAFVALGWRCKVKKIRLRRRFSDALAQEKDRGIAGAGKQREFTVKNHPQGLAP